MCSRIVMWIFQCIHLEFTDYLPFIHNNDREGDYQIRNYKYEKSILNRLLHYLEIRDRSSEHKPHEEGHEEFADKPTYEMAQRVAQRMMTAYAEGHTDRVDVVYYKFISAGTQRLVCEQLLPIEIGPAAEENIRSTEYILEPDRTELIASIVPRQITLKIYAAALSASASEHAARMMAMQAATDNADTLIADLALEYNKQRQQAITTELLDIMGGQNGR